MRRSTGAESWLLVVLSALWCSPGCYAKGAGPGEDVQCPTFGSGSAGCSRPAHCLYPLLRLRGGKIGRRTKPKEVPREYWTKRYQADWDPLKLRDKRVHDPERGLSRSEYVKVPGSYWAFGKKLPDRAPNMTVGRDIPYEKAYLKEGAVLFHPDTMEPLNLKRIWGDPDDPWYDLRWDPRDIDDEIRRRMYEPDIYHPYIAMLMRYHCENDAFRARSTREATARLMASSSSSSSQLPTVSTSAGRQPGAGHVCVPQDEATIPQALLRLRTMASLQKLEQRAAAGTPEQESNAERRRIHEQDSRGPRRGGAAVGVVEVTHGVHSWPDLNEHQVARGFGFRVSFEGLHHCVS